MDKLCKAVKTEYDYALKTYSPCEECADGILSERDVFNAHFVLADYFIKRGEEARFGILNYDMLSSAVARQSVGFAGQQKWKDHYTKVATLSFGLDKNHAFQDCNKRTALLCMLLALHCNKRHLVCRKSELELLLIRIAANEMHLYKDFKKYKKHGDDAIVMYVANFLRKNSRIIDNQYRVLTYEEFNSKLKKYDVWLDNAQGGYIDVMQNQTSKTLFGLKTTTKPTKIYQIGFKGWKAQINMKAMKCVLKEAGLTTDKGVDLHTFYEGEEPEYILIEEYFEVLKRLKDK